MRTSEEESGWNPCFLTPPQPVRHVAHSSLRKPKACKPQGLAPEHRGGSEAKSISSYCRAMSLDALALVEPTERSEGVRTQRANLFGCS